MVNFTNDTLHAAVKEYLELAGFEEALMAFEEELDKKHIILNTSLLPDPCEGEHESLKIEIFNEFVAGNSKDFWNYWEKNIPEDEMKSNDVQKLIFSLHLYFAIYPMISNEHLLSPIEDSMNEFKRYLENNATALSQTADFVAYYALPYVPNPRTHPTFKPLFEDKWKDDLRIDLRTFLDHLFNSDPVPYLYKLYKNQNSQTEKQPTTDSSVNEEKINQLTVQNKNLEKVSKQHERRADNYYHKFAKVQGDYHNLIGISAELVDSLEKCVRGEMISPEYLQDICERLFNQTNNGGNNQDTIKPDSTGDFLRASIAKDENQMDKYTQQDFSTLDYEKLSNDLAGSLPPRKKALILQALIWRLTKVPAGATREHIISSYLNNDILGCTQQHIPDYIVKIFQHDDVVSEYLARFINTVASFSYGRFYISQSDEFVKFMIRVMRKCKTDSLTSENIIGGLQKLSLRRHVQTIMIDSAVIEWLLSTLDEPDNLSDYAIEYTAALLMNLCLRVSGKKKCSLHPQKVLKSLTDLLGRDNEEIRPYLNGTLYSILSLPSIRDTAMHMGLGDILELYLKDKSHDERQIRFIIKQMETVDSKNDDDVVSEDDDEDDDEEGDAVESESEKEESIKATLGEKCGESILQEYMNNDLFLPSVSISASVPNKTKRNMLSASQDEPYTRPVTPAHKPAKHTHSDSEVYRSPRVTNEISNERPRTSSGKGSRKVATDRGVGKTSNQLKPHQGRTEGKTGYKQAFASRPKIPRTPEVNSSRPSSSESRGSRCDVTSPNTARTGSAKGMNRTTPR